MQANIGVRAALIVGILLLVAAPTVAATPNGSATNRAARDEALRAIPLARLAASDRARVSKVLVDSSIFRRLPTQVIDCDPEFYLYLVEHPELVVEVWRVLGISTVTLDRDENETLHADDGAGTVGKVDLIYRSQEAHVFYADGCYDGPVFNQPLKGQCVLLLRSSYVRKADGTYSVTCRLDSFLHLDNATLEVLAKVMQPLVGQIADHNFRETTLFVAALHQAAQCNLAGLDDVISRMKDVRPEICQQFAELSEQVAVEAAIAKTEALRAAARAQSGEGQRTVRRPSAAVPQR
ncbi:MAG TPA: hypothetical protein VG713_22250 [Pirellulales bacterium]|nr:hypothetical protein [Pirellulales bacterium]